MCENVDTILQSLRHHTIFKYKKLTVRSSNIYNKKHKHTQKAEMCVKTK